MDFNAGVKIEGQQLDNLLSEGHKMIPSQWIETDQNEHLKRPGKIHTPDLKSRLVACGQHEDTRGLRADSPTCDVEGLNLMCSFAACNKIRLKSADLKNAYFHGKPLDRLLLIRPPKGGIPGEDPNQRCAIAARVPIYGTKDAGRMFYKKVREVALDAGFSECKYMRGLYFYQEDGDI